MSQSEQLMKIANGVVNFCTEMRGYLENTKESFDTVLNRHYQANHTPYAVMSFEDEAHYWEEQLCKKILEIQHPEWSMEGQEVEVIQRDTYVIIRGNLKSGKTIRYDESKFNQLYINGERYTGDYTFNGETPETYERLVIVAVQTPFNLGQKIYGELDILPADFSIKNAEIFVNIGKFSGLQPNVDELIMEDTAESLYVRGDWTWTCKDYSYLKTLSVSDNLFIGSQALFALPSLRSFLIPNTSIVPANTTPYSLIDIDISNCNIIGSSAFMNSALKDSLYVNPSFSLEQNCISHCDRLTSVVIGNKTQTIGPASFYECKKLNSAYIGDNVHTIGNNAFYGCSNLQTLHLGKSVTTIANVGALGGYSSNLILTVSKGYHCPSTPLGSSSNLNWRCFLEILENCAMPGEDGRPGLNANGNPTPLVFDVHANVITQINSASKYSGTDEAEITDKEIAQRILNLCTEKGVNLA